jgi:hypothetical protein
MLTYFFGYLYTKNFKYSILKDFILVIRQSDGPAIKGGCVTRRQHRVGSWYFSRKAVTVQGGYGVLFAVMVQFLLSITRVAVQV